LFGRATNCATHVQAKDAHRMAPLSVLIGEDIGPDHLARLRREFPQVEFHFCLAEGDFIAAAPHADIMFSKSFPRVALDAATRLRWVQAGTAGVERLLSAGLVERGILITNATGAHGTPMAEVILAMMLAFATGLNRLIRAQVDRQDIRDDVLHTKFELAGQTLCVIGLGDIGGTLALKASALGMHVIGVRRTPRPTPGVATLVPLDVPSSARLSWPPCRAMPISTTWAAARPSILRRSSLRCLRAGSRARGWTSPYPSRCPPIRRCGACPT
jgi:hypothetical protein